uniref:Uncharacterized protein n=1 Tax=Solibacter usitatus (strain Ellin6076) TaxID=234267 RepID=Q01Z16_SOLUE
MAGKDPLLLRSENLRLNTARLFDRLNTDRAAREEFIRNPAGAVSEEIAGRELQPAQESAANRMLFAILANARFLAWFDNYRAVQGGQPPSREQFGRDFAQAVLRFDDSDLLKSVIGQAAEGVGFPGDTADEVVVGPEPQAIAVHSPNSSQVEAKSVSIAFGDRAIVDPAFLRSIVDQLIKYAEELKQQGRLGDLGQAIR